MSEHGYAWASGHSSILMDQPSVTRLYKYSAFNAHSMASLVTEKLWFANPSTFNDPFDCVMPNHASVYLAQITVGAAKRRAKAVKASERKADDIAQRIRALHEKVMTGISAEQVAQAQKFAESHDSIQSSINILGVLSMSATPRSILMWSHYGAQHTGICLEFERTATNKLGTDASPVVYSKLLDAALDSAQQPSANFMFKKYSGWRYEREWRLLENTSGLHAYPGRLLSVICGARMPAPEREVVARIVAGLNVSRSDKISVRAAAMKLNRPGAVQTYVLRPRHTPLPLTTAPSITQPSADRRAAGCL